MAEARSAVSYRVEKTNLLLQVSDEEIVLRINRNLLPITWKKLRSAAYKRAVKFRNSLFNAFYPAPPYHWALVIGGSVYSMIYKPGSLLSQTLWGLEKYVPSSQSVSPTLRATLISAAVGTGAIFVMSHVRKFILSSLLGYQGWLYDNPRTQSKKTIIWGILVKLISGQHGLRLFSKQKPLLYSNQDALPKLPVPSLDQTCSKYLQSVAPLLSPEEYSQMQKLVASFKKNEGRRLQRYLVLKSWLTPNYVSDWWLNYVYLRGRSPIIINSNYYVLDCGLPNPPTTQPVARAAKLIANFLEFKHLVDREKLAPMVIRDTVPMCMNQYEKIFSTARIPGKEMDFLEHFDYDSNHIVVFRKGQYYVVDMYDDYGQPLTICEIENQLKWIVRDADKNTPTLAEANIAALTTDNRTTWANAREEFFGFGLNKASLDAIDKALFMVVLEEGNPEDYPIGDWSTMARSLFHGNGGNRWSDKSFNLVILPNGKAGLNTEHSWADAPVMAHAWEYAIFANKAHDASSYTSDGFNIRTKCRPRPPPVRLRWDFSAKAEKVILNAFENCKALINDINLEVITHLSYGKGFIKKCKVSPDAYVQLAMQLAYKRDTGKLDLAYESSMTRLFKLGRTETVRPVTIQSKAFIDSMDNPNLSKKDKIKLLVEAGDVHQNSYRDCMTGKGIDRHLFALYVVSQGINVKSEFLNNALSMKWKLSTSQQPQNQTDFWDSVKNPELISPGGGFGPVADDGYGVSYMIAGEDRLFFHISSKRSSPCDSKRFGERIIQSLKEMKELFE